MDNVTTIRIVAAIAFLVVFVILVRRRSSHRLE
jgi:hypothetical protein